MHYLYAPQILHAQANDAYCLQVSSAALLARLPRGRAYHFL
jgi:hypothetical protein